MGNLHHESVNRVRHQTGWKKEQRRWRSNRFPEEEEQLHFHQQPSALKPPSVVERHPIRREWTWNGGSTPGTAS